MECVLNFDVLLIVYSYFSSAFGLCLMAKMHSPWMHAVVSVYVGCYSLTRHFSLLYSTVSASADELSFGLGILVGHRGFMILYLLDADHSGGLAL